MAETDKSAGTGTPDSANENAANGADTVADGEVLEYEFRGYRLDVRQRRLSAPDNTPLPLSSRAFDTLLTLLKAHGQTLSKAELMAQVWPNAVVEENNLNQAISSLRKALGDSRSNTRFILTVPGRGYCFIADVSTRTASSASTSEDANDAAPDTGRDLTPAAKTARHPERRGALIGGVLAAGLLVAAGVLMLRGPGPAPGNDAPGGTTLVADSVSATPALLENSIAVLPFSSLNPDQDNLPFVAGLHDELITQLSKVRSLNVIARDSVLALPDRDLPLAELSRMLKVESVMTGTVLFAGAQARISLQLLDPATGLTLWADTYEADRDDMAEMLTIQGDIARHVATALETEVRSSEQANIAAMPTTDFEAYRYNMAAKYAYYQQDFVKTWQLSRLAIEHDPNYFDAHHMFSTVNTVMLATPLPGMERLEHFDLALASAEKIIEIAPERSDGYALKAVALNSIKDWQGVARTIDTLLAMDVPKSELKYMALVFLCLGDFDTAIEIYEANLVTEPLNFFGRGFLMAAYELAGQRDKSRETYLTGEELNPVWWGDTVNVFLALGRHEALEDLDEIVGLSPPLREMLNNVNDRELVVRGIGRYLDSGALNSVESLYYAALAAYHGQHEQAVVLMRESLQDVWTSMFWLWLPVFDETRRLDSFRDFISESGLPGFWRGNGWPDVCQPAGDSFDCHWQAYPN